MRAAASGSIAGPEWAGASQCSFGEQGATGGKLHVFMSSLPRNGAHALRQREAPMGSSAKDALAIMAPALPDYKALAVTAADAQVHAAINLRPHGLSGLTCKLQQ